MEIERIQSKIVAGLVSKDALTKYRDRFLEKRIEVNVDGTSELWELEDFSCKDNIMTVRYKLKDKTNYKV